MFTLYAASEKMIENYQEACIFSSYKHVLVELLWYRLLSIYLLYLSTIVNKLIPCIHAWADFDQTWTQWWLGGGPSEVVPNLGFKVTRGPWGPILCRYSKCFFSYRFNDIMLRVCHYSTVGGVPSGCSGFLGPRSRMGHFMKSRKMLLLLQIVWYNVEGSSR